MRGTPCRWRCGTWAGDEKAILPVLRIIDRLLGLDKPGVWKAEPETVVLSPDQLAAWKETQGRDA